MYKPLIIFLFLNSICLSQTLKRTVGIYSTELNQKGIRGKSRQTKVTLNTNTGVLIVEDNLAAIKSDDLKTDSLNKNVNSINLKFEGNIQKPLSAILKENQNAVLMRIEGIIAINGISKECVALWAPLMLNPSSNDLLIDFEIKFVCEDFNLNDLKFPFTSLVEFEIEDGLINKIE